MLSKRRTYRMLIRSRHPCTKPYRTEFSRVGRNRKPSRNFRGAAQRTTVSMRRAAVDSNVSEAIRSGISSAL